MTVEPKWLHTVLPHSDLTHLLQQPALVSHRAAMAQVMETDAVDGVARIMQVVAEKPVTLVAMVLDATQDWKLRSLDPAVYHSLGTLNPKFLLSYGILGN